MDFCLRSSTTISASVCIYLHSQNPHADLSVCTGRRIISWFLYTVPLSAWECRAGYYFGGEAKKR